MTLIGCCGCVRNHLLFTFVVIAPPAALDIRFIVVIVVVFGVIIIFHCHVNPILKEASV